MATRTRGRVYADVTVGDFSGGLNVRDALTELAPNESPDLWNVTTDERGGIRKRLGYSKWNASAAANLITYHYESSVVSLILHYSKADGKLYSDPGTGVLTLRKTFTANGRLSIVDFAGVVYAIHSADGLWKSTDGTSWSALVATSGSLPTGDQLAVWQNKLWVASSTSNLLSFSAPGDATKWASGDDAGSNYIREGNDFPIVCLYGAAGADYQTNPSLIVGKRSGAQGSVHRVIDAATADYVTIDQAVGPGGPGSITSLYGVLYIISPTGAYSTDGQSALVPAGQKIAPLFDPNHLDYSQASGFVAGRQNGRVFFSVARVGSTGNDLCLEYDPLSHAFTARSDAMAWYSSYGATGDVLLGSSSSVTGQVYKLNDTVGSDDGAAITSWFLTKVFEPAGRYEARLQHIRAVGTGDDLTLSAIKDFDTSGVQKVVSLGTTDGFEWDSDGWDDPDVGWGNQTLEGYADFRPRIRGRAFQFRVDESSTATALQSPLLESTNPLTVGAWAVYGLTLSFTPLVPA